MAATSERETDGCERVRIGQRIEVSAESAPKRFGEDREQRQEQDQEQEQSRDRNQGEAHQERLVGHAVRCAAAGRGRRSQT